MDHSYFKDKISAYSDGALEPQERELIRRHLEECAECRKLLEEFRLLSEAVEKHSGLSGDEYFEKLATKIENRIAQPKEKVVDVSHFRWRSLVWKVSAAAASVLLVGIIGYYQFVEDDELPKKLMESSSPVTEADMEVIDSVTEDNAVEETGRLQADKDGKVLATENEFDKQPVSKPDLARDKAKSESGQREIIKNAPGSVAKTTNAERRADEPVPAVEAPQESKEAGGKEMVGQTAGDESAERQESQNERIVVADSVPVGGLAQVPEQNLKDLRTRNAFLQNQILQDGKANYRYDDNIQKSSRSLLSLKSAADNKVPDSIYQQLAISWYQISQFTSDKIEKDQAKQYLNWYKQNFPDDSMMANQYLKEIKE